MSEETVTVPPGHKVVVVHPVKVQNFGLTKSGWYILDYGIDDEWKLANKTAMERLKTKGSINVIAILQSEFIENRMKAGDLSALIGELVAIRDGNPQSFSATFVLPMTASTQQGLVDSLKARGFQVHGSAPDGACFVEVHKPDGTIIIGMPGPRL